MKPNEIKKALECCVKGRFSSRWNCTNKECPYYFKELFCVQECKASALAYINQLEAEVEQLKANSDSRQTNENIDVAHIKAEVVKAFSEAVKMEFYYEFDEIIPSIMADKIDSLVKEMVGDEE